MIHPKTDEQRKRLQVAVKDILIFKSLDQEQREYVLDAMFEKQVRAKLTFVTVCLASVIFYHVTIFFVTIMLFDTTVHLMIITR